MAGAIQAAAGVAMYLAGVYFAPWSMGVSVGVLLLCIVVGTSWYTTHFLNNEITYPQAVLVGMTISVCTGLVYACYNVITISYFYPHFLDEVVRTRLAEAGAQQQGSESFAAMRAQVSAPGIAIPNLVRLSVFGTALSVVTSFFLNRKVR
ncbi:MAG: DUF4199 domain-containing protein [Vicinamibacteria bacterium]|nr:DUF4199 domain-containing protein [Vicinamibacteria bacterium]